MSRHLGSFNRSLSYPSNLHCHSPNISNTDLTSSPLPSFTNNSPRSDSDDDSTNTIFHTISKFKISDVESPDEFQNSEPSPSTFSQTPSVHSTPQLPMNLPQLLLPTPTQPQSSYQLQVTKPTPLAPSMKN